MGKHKFRQAWPLELSGYWQLAEERKLKLLPTSPRANCVIKSQLQFPVIRHCPRFHTFSNLTSTEPDIRTIFAQVCIRGHTYMLFQVT